MTEIISPKVNTMHRLNPLLCSLALAGCALTRPDSSPPPSVAMTTDLLEAGHTRAATFLFLPRADWRIQLQQATATLRDPTVAPTAKRQAAQTVRALGRRVDQMIVATQVQEDRVIQATTAASAACQPDRFYRTGAGVAPAVCARYTLALGQWRQDRRRVHAARDQLQQVRGDAEAAIVDSGVTVGPAQPYHAPAALTCRPLPAAQPDAVL